MSTPATRTVRVRRDASHVPNRHRGEEAKIVEERTFSTFGGTWYRLRFEDGWEQWVPADRLEEVAA